MLIVFKAGDKNKNTPTEKLYQEPLMKIISTLLIGMSFFSTAINADILTLIGDNWCPYNCRPDSANPGFMVEVAYAAFTQAGDGVNYEVMDWKDAVKGVREGKYDALIGASHQTTSDFVFPDQELAIIHQSFWIPKEQNWKYEGTHSLKGKLLAVIEEYEYGEPLDTYIKEYKDDPTRIKFLTSQNSDVQGIRFLEANPQTGVFLEENVTMMSYLQQVGKQFNFKGIPSLLPPIKIYIAFSPKNPESREYAKKLSTGISELKRSGKWKKLLDKYHLPSW